MKPVLENIKKKIKLFISIIVTVVISYFIYTELTNSFEYLNPYYIWRYLKESPKVLSLERSNIYIPRMSSIEYKEYKDDKTIVQILFVQKEINYGFVDIFELKDVNQETMKKMFEIENLFYSHGDILPLIFVYKYEMNEMYIMYREEWTFKGKGSIPVEILTIIPDKHLYMLFHFENLSIDNILEAVNTLIYDNSVIDFEYDKERTLQLEKREK